MLGSGFHQFAVQVHRLFAFFGRDIQDIGNTAFRFPAIHFHFQDIDYGVERRAASNRILNLYDFASPTVFQLSHGVFIIGLFVIQLVHNEDDRFVELLRVAELVDSPHFDAVLRIQHHQSRVGNIQSGDSAADEIVGARTVDKVQFPVLPFHAEDSRENGVSVFLFNRKIIANRVLIFYGTATFYDTTLVKHCFSESGFPRARTSQYRDILNFICLIYFHLTLGIKWLNNLFGAFCSPM